MESVQDEKNISGANFAGEALQNNFLYIKYISYVVMGIILLIVNGPVVINILYQRILRAKKEYLLLAGLSAADFCIGLSTVFAGTYRWNLMDRRAENDLLSPWECVLRPNFALLTFSLLAQAGMYFVVTLDRLIAVIKPLQHNTFSTTYAYSIVAACFTLALLLAGSMLAYLVITYSGSATTAKLSALCSVSPVDKIYDSLHCVRTVLAILSVVLYVIVWYMYRKFNQTTVVRFPSATQKLRRSQRHLTVTVGICVIFTLCLYVIPTTVQVIAIWTPLAQRMGSWHDLPCVLIFLNAIINVFVYSLRHEDIRNGMKLTFCCRQLPSAAAIRLKKESQLTIVSNSSSGKLPSAVASSAKEH